MPDLLIDGLAHLIAQLAAQLGVRVDRLLARMDRMDRRQQLAFISEAFPELIDPFLAATAEATAGVYDELPAAPGGFVATGGDLLPRGLLAAKGRIGLLERSPRDALAGIGDQLLHRQSRETMVANAVRENVRWGRHASASACGWCRMLATRGAVYGSAELAESSHPRCHCMAVPARNGRYEEAPYVEQWREDYAQARRDGATTPGQIANAMDKAEGGRRAPATQSSGGGGKPPTKPPAASKSAAGEPDEPWSGHAKGYVHPHGEPLWTESERRQRQGKLGIVPAGEQLYQHEIQTIERLQALGETMEWIPRDTETFLPTNDIRWTSQGGIEADLKSTGATYPAISRRIKKAVERAIAAGVTKPNFVVDIGARDLTAKVHRQLSLYNQRHPNGQIDGLWILGNGRLTRIDLAKVT